VAFGSANLKTHATARRAAMDGIRRYVHLGSGNYNSNGASLYGCGPPHGPSIGADVSDLFNRSPANRQLYRKLVLR
jgi:polyphosphate kinase